jgi:cysteinyl-tRNA synthetase
MLALFDTLSGRKRAFKPLRGRTVGIYTCGPSVYSYSHLGNFRTYLFEDVLVRYLRYKGFRVKRVMNITDVEDKAVAAARKEGIALEALEADKARAFWKDFDSLGMVRPDIVAKASEHVPLMTALIGRLCRKGYCIHEDDGVYFNVRRFARYGELRRLRNRVYLGRMRNEDYSREGAWDFRLWKKWTRGDGSAGWDSPLGYGRPGWHIECSAMSMHYLGESFDIHCGGTDNIFPHHENEIAQSEAASGKKFANFWLHSRHLTLGKKKMSKRTGNVVFVKDILALGVHPECLRFYLLSKSYRRRLDFTVEEFGGRVCACERTGTTLAKLRKLRGRRGGGVAGKEIAGKLIASFEKAMDDDLDTGRAFRSVFSAFEGVEAGIGDGELTGADATRILGAMRKIDSVLGVFF